MKMLKDVGNPKLKSKLINSIRNEKSPFKYILNR
jgi:hypothetical protein